MRLILLSLLCITTLLGLNGCYYDNEEDLYGANTQKCDTAGVVYTYTQHIKPILANNCLACHNATLQEGGVRLDQYGGVKPLAQNGVLVGVAAHQTGFKAMPPSNIKIPECDIQTLDAWARQGATE